MWTFGGTVISLSFLPALSNWALYMMHKYLLNGLCNMRHTVFKNIALWIILMWSKQNYFQKLKWARPQNLSQMSTRNIRRQCQKLKHGQPFLHPHQEIAKKMKKCNSRIWNCTWKFRLVSLKVEKLFKSIMNSIPTPSPSVKI